MKFKEIRPGMVIHCPKEEDARALLKRLKELGYDVADTHPELEWRRWKDKLTNGIYYTIVSHDYWTWSDSNDLYADTEFSDLVEPDSPINSPTDSPMSAMEVLEWFRDNYSKGNAMCKAFGGDIGFARVLINYAPEEIIDRITAYEAAKKAPKTVEVEYGWYCKVLDEHWLIVDRKEMWEGDEEKAKDEAAEMACQHVIKNGGKAFYRVYSICRVKEGK